MRPILPGLVLLFLLSSTAHAAWNANGNVVASATRAQVLTGLAPDGSGGAYFAWTDARAADNASEAYVQRMKGDGTIAPGWPVGGIPASASGSVDRVSVQPDGGGGALLIWRQGNPRGFYIQRVDANGSIHPGWPATGRRLNDDFSSSTFAVTGGPGGSAWLAWTRQDGFGFHAMLTRVDSSGTAVAPFDTAGVQLAADELIPSLSLATDSTGAVIYSVGTYFNAQVDQIHVRVGRVNTAKVGTIGLTLPYGERQLAGTAIADGQGGLFAAWSTQNTFPVSSGLWAQHFGPAGEKLWPDSVAVPFLPVLVRAADGGVYHLGASAANQLLVIHRLADGSIAPGWPAGGLAFTTGPGLAQIGGMATGQGLLVTWAEAGNGTDLRALGVLQTGALDPAWPANGAVVCNAAGNQGGYSAFATATGGALFGWSDDRGSSTDVYANRVEVSPPIGVVPFAGAALAFRAIAPNPSRGLVRVELALDAQGLATLDLIDVRGRVLTSRKVAASSTLSTERLPAGLYWLRATLGASIAVGRIVVLE